MEENLKKRPVLLSLVALSIVLKNALSNLKIRWCCEQTHFGPEGPRMLGIQIKFHEQIGTNIYFWKWYWDIGVKFKWKNQ